MFSNPLYSEIKILKQQESNMQHQFANEKELIVYFKKIVKIQYTEKATENACLAAEVKAKKKTQRK